MTALKNILAATDFSAPARQACDRAARLARESGAQLHLAHGVSAGALEQLRGLLGQDGTVEQNLLNEAQRTLDTLAGELTRARGMTVQTCLLRGAVLQAISTQADAIDADLMVLGARGAGFVRRIALGTTSERLLRKSLRPLLVVKQKAHEPYRRVLVPVDFSASSAGVLQLARSVAPGAHLVLLHAYEVPFEGKLRFAGVDQARIEGYRTQELQSATSRLHALAAQVGLVPSDWTPCLLYADASLAIVEQEQELDCDLIAIGKHGQSMAEELLLGSVTKHVLAESVGDVLVSTSRQA